MRAEVPSVEPMRTRDDIRRWWDADAEVYDRVPNHALSDPVEAAAWRAALTANLPPPPARILDAGAGTGAIALLLAELGHPVTALDLSERMLERARDKAAERGLEIDFVVGPVEEPPAGPFDAVVERHVLWTTLDPQAVLRSWRAAAPGGRLLLLEGLWSAQGVVARARSLLAERLRGGRREHGGHHGGHHAAYDPHLVARLPLAAARTPRPLLRAVVGAGWVAPRIVRLRDVEWARHLAAGEPLGTLQHAPQYAIAAEDRRN